MVTIKLNHLDGSKETAHFQSIDKCSQWMNLHYKKVASITYMDSRKSEKIEFPSKRAFEEFCDKRTKNEN